MTDPTSYAAGIEAAARVAENFRRQVLPPDRQLVRKIEDAIRTLAPECGGGSEPTEAEISKAALNWCGKKERETFLDDELYFKANWRALPGLRQEVEAVVAQRSPAPPAASGFPGADEWDEISEADKQTLERVQETLPVEDLEALERIVEARVNRARAAAPPPPVPAQAESGSTIARLNDENDRLVLRIRELEGEAEIKDLAITTARSVIRELEGEVARANCELRNIEAGIERAEARAETALASLASVLDGGKG